MSQADLDAYLAAVEERARAMEAAGLPECEWINAQAGVQPGTLDEMARLQREMTQHFEACPTCIARTRYAETLPPLPDLPAPAWMRLLQSPVQRLLRLHPVVRDAVIGGALIGFIVLLRAIFAPMVVARAPLEFVRVLLLAMAAGAVGGAVSALVRPPLRRLGRAGDYLAGMITVFAYLVALNAVFPFAEDASLTVSLGIVAAMSVIFGAVIGHSWFRPQKV